MDAQALELLPPAEAQAAQFPDRSPIGLLARMRAGPQNTETDPKQAHQRLPGRLLPLPLALRVSVIGPPGSSLGDFKKGEFLWLISHLIEGVKGQQLQTQSVQTQFEQHLALR